MKPIHLNLASRPYRDYRPVYAVVVAVSLLTAFLMLNNIDTYYRYIRETRTTRDQIAGIEAQIQQERKKEEAARQRLSGIDLERLDDQTRFVNTKLVERAFSWSALLDELESILVDDVRLVSVAPSFENDGRIKLRMSFETRSSDGMITTVNRMIKNPRFVQPQPTSETVIEGGWSFHVDVQYFPDNVQNIVRTKSAPEVKR